MVSQQFSCGKNGCDEQHALSEGEAENLSQQTSDGLRTAIAAEIKSIASRGVSIGTLNELARFSHTAQELLMIRTPLAEVRRKKRLGAAMQGPAMQTNSTYSGSIGSYGGPGGFVMSPYQDQYGYDEDDTDVGSLTQEAAQNETFGAKLTREVVSALGSLKRNTGPSVKELIESIAQAKDAGLGHIVSKLEGALDEALGKEGEPEPTPATGRPRYPVPGIPMAQLGSPDDDADDPEDGSEGDLVPPGQVVTALAPPSAQIAQMGQAVQ